MANAAFDPTQRTWIPEPKGGASPIPGIEGSVTCDPAVLDEYATDFGRIVSERPGAVLRAANAKDVAAALRFCADHGIPTVARAFGQSGHGQAQGRGALAIDVRALNRIEDVRHDRMTAGTAVTWRELMMAGLEKGVTPPVFTNHIGVSIGGSITVGGIGIASHRYGLQADNVAELDVATTSGEIVTCSERTKPELFRAALAGLGQFGIITKLTLRPIPAPERVAMLRVAYDDIPALLSDAFHFSRRNRFDTVDNRIGVPPDGGPLQCFNDVGLFLYDGEEAPDLSKLVGKTRGNLEPQQVMDYAAYMQRDDEYVHFVGTIMGELAKPWCVFIIPESETEKFVMQGLVPLLNPGAGGFAFFAQPYPTRLTRSTSFPLPRSKDEWVSVVGVVRVLPPPRVEEALAEHRALFEQALAVGGTIYPYGSIPLNDGDWAKIFGDRWAEYAARKRVFDPKGILNTSYGIRA